jgi:hypothetical protein
MWALAHLLGAMDALGKITYNPALPPKTTVAQAPVGCSSADNCHIWDSIG